MTAFEADPAGFDIVITDMTMPKVCGDELAGRLLLIRKDIPILLCSGYHETFNHKAARQVGIRRFIRKPVTGMEIAAIVRKEMDGG